MTSSDLVTPIDLKLEAVREAAARKFSRRGATARLSTACAGGAGQKAPIVSAPLIDPRLADYIYESTFSEQPTADVATSSESVESRPTSLESARGLIFDLPAFKTAAERVAYEEDLLMRAVSLLEGMTRCPRCASNNTTFTVRQMHSSDEAPTMMLYCGSCQHRTNQTGE